MPKPRFSDITMAKATQEVKLSGTVTGKEAEAELLQQNIKKPDINQSVACIKRMWELWRI